MEFGSIISSSVWNPTVTAPESMANKTFTQVLDTMVNWTQEYRTHFQERLRYDGHLAVCGLVGKFYPMTELIEYPNITTAFAPDDVCTARNLPSSGNRQAVTQFSLEIVAIISVAVVVMLWNSS